MELLGRVKNWAPYAGKNDMCNEYSISPVFLKKVFFSSSIKWALSMMFHISVVIGRKEEN